MEYIYRERNVSDNYKDSKCKLTLLSKNNCQEETEIKRWLEKNSFMRVLIIYVTCKQGPHADRNCIHVHAGEQ